MQIIYGNTEPNYTINSTNETLIDISSIVWNTPIITHTGIQDVEASFMFNDGFNNNYQYTIYNQFEVMDFNQPLFDIEIIPENPHIYENFTITPIYNEDYPKGTIIYIDYSFDNIHVFNNCDKSETKTYQYQEKIINREIQATVYYDTGFETKSFVFTKPIYMSSTAPVSTFTTNSNTLTVPKYSWTDTATDIDGIDDIIQRRFQLYYKTGEEYSLINTKFINKGETFYNVFGFEGDYKITYTVTDTDNLSSESDSYFNVTVADTPTTPPDSLSGSIYLENGWQLICIPTINGYYNSGIIKDSTTANIKNYFINQIIEKLNLTSETELSQYIEVINCFIGKNSNSIFQSYIPGVTNPNSSGNFQLAYVDPNSLKYEFTAFWVKIIKPINILIEWEFHKA